MMVECVQWKFQEVFSGLVSMRFRQESAVLKSQLPK